MKFLVIALFVAAATAAPLEDDSGPVEVIVNGVPEGQPIDLSDIVDIKLKEHSNGQVAATNLLHPYTAVGIAEAAAAESAVAADAAALQPKLIIPQPVVLPAPVAPEVAAPAPVSLPSPVAPEVAVVPEPVVLPSPVAPEVAIPESVFPQPVVLPSPVAPEVAIVPEPVVLPSPVAPEVVEPIPASLPTGEVFNDGTVSVTVNAPQQAGVFTTIQGWFSMVLNYFNDGVQTTQHIV